MEKDIKTDSLNVLLKDARTKKKITIEEMAQKLLITKSRLIEIEAGNYDFASNKLYMKLLIKKYAKLVDIPEKTYLPLLAEIIPEDEFEKTVNQSDYLNNYDSRKIKVKKKINRQRILVGIVIAVIIIVTLFMGRNLVRTVVSIYNDNITTSEVEENEKTVINEEIAAQEAAEQAALAEIEAAKLLSETNSEVEFTSVDGQNYYFNVLNMPEGQYKINISVPDGSSYYDLKVGSQVLAEGTIEAGRSVDLIVRGAASVLNISNINDAKISINGVPINFEPPSDPHVYLHFTKLS